MFKKSIAFLLLAILFGNGCRKHDHLRDNYFLFGYEPVDCSEKDCVQAYLLMNGKLYEDAMQSRDKKNNASQKELRFSLLKEDEQQLKLAKELKDGLPLEFLTNSATNSFGETGNELGYYYVELKTNATVKRWYFTTYNDRLMPAELHDFVQKLANTFTELGKD